MLYTYSRRFCEFEFLNGLAIPQPIIERRDQLCNGHADLCGRQYGNVTYLGAHDSFAASPNPFALARTQEVDVTTQLMMGVRLLQLQAHMNRGILHFCHTSCSLFDGGKVADYFRIVKHFLDRHPNEVLTIILANPESVPASEWQPIFASTGLEEMVYVPPLTLMTRDDWPTLQEMLDTGRRVVVFMDKGTEDEPVPYILSQFEMVWEDEYDPSNPKFPCAVDRSSGDLYPEQKLNLINHNLNINILPFGPHGMRIPDRLASPRTNSVASIMSHANHCAPLANDNLPTFVLVDFVNIGQAVTAVAQLNGFEY